MRIVRAVAFTLLIAHAPAPPVHASAAAAGGLVMAGRGGATPPVDMTPSPTQITLQTEAGVGAGAGLDVSGTDITPGLAVGVMNVADFGGGCEFEANGTESLPTGSGTVSGSCEFGIAPNALSYGDVVCNWLPYTRVGVIVVAAGLNACMGSVALETHLGRVSVGPPATATAAVFVLVATSNPVENFLFVGVGAFAGARL